MLIFDLNVIGDRLYDLRTKKLLSRAEVAEKAELSDRTYADIERGHVNMRLETLLKICKALNITPNDILTVEPPRKLTEADLISIMNACSQSEKETALNLLHVYLESLRK